jgi:hypothetical protein
MKTRAPRSFSIECAGSMSESRRRYGFRPCRRYLRKARRVPTRRAENRQIVDVFGDRKGPIDGVEFDLTHEHLHAKNSLPPVSDNLPDKPTNAPYRWFPWYGTFAPVALWDKTRKVVARRETANFRYISNQPGAPPQIRGKVSPSTKSMTKASGLHS